MTIGELTQEVKDYLHVDGEPVGENLVIVDRLILSALNKARKQAERENDFALALVHGTVTVSPTTGGDLNMVTVAGTGIVSMKSVVNGFLEKPAGSGNLYPLRRRPRRVYVGMIHKSNQLLDSSRPDDWPTPPRPSESGVAMELLTFGNAVFLEPGPTVASPVVLDGYRWMPDYTGAGDRDFFTDHGHDFLLWQAVMHVNRRLEVFVQRQEGTLPPPSDARDEAWESLLKWDSYLHEEGREHELGS